MHSPTNVSSSTHHVESPSGQHSPHRHNSQPFPENYSKNNPPSPQLCPHSSLCTTKTSATVCSFLVYKARTKTLASPSLYPARKWLSLWSFCWYNSWCRTMTPGARRRIRLSGWPRTRRWFPRLFITFGPPRPPTSVSSPLFSSARRSPATGESYRRSSASWWSNHSLRASLWNTGSASDDFPFFLSDKEILC